MRLTPLFSTMVRLVIVSSDGNTVYASVILIPLLLSSNTSSSVSASSFLSFAIGSDVSASFTPLPCFASRNLRSIVRSPLSPHDAAISGMR